MQKDDIKPIAFDLSSIEAETPKRKRRLQIVQWLNKLLDGLLSQMAKFPTAVYMMMMEK